MFNALGIVAYNDNSIYVEGLDKHRPIAAFNFPGRYRLMDFPVSNMANSGMDCIDVYTNGDPKVLFEHVGDGRHYNINSKHGHVGIIPVFTDGQRPSTVPDVQQYYNNLYQIERDVNEFVIIAPDNYIYKCNYADLLDTHAASGADVSILYQKIDTAREEFINCDILEFDKDHRVTAIDRNRGTNKNRNLSLMTYVMSKKVFVDLVKKARATSAMFWFRDILNASCADMNIKAVNYRGHVYSIYDLRSYFQSNLKMLNEENFKDFNDPDWPIYTRTNDSAPASYLPGGSTNRTFVSNGCQIAGEVTNSIVGRGVTIGKDASVDNCVILPGAEIGDNANLCNVVIDKGAHIVHKKDLAGTVDEPVYIDRRETV